MLYVLTREVNPTKLATLLLISVTAFAVLSGICIAMTFNTNTFWETAFISPSLKPTRIPDVSAMGPSVQSADPISDGKPN